MEHWLLLRSSISILLLKSTKCVIIIIIIIIMPIVNHLFALCFVARCSMTVPRQFFCHFMFKWKCVKYNLLSSFFPFRSRNYLLFFILIGKVAVVPRPSFDDLWLVIISMISSSLCSEWWICGWWTLNILNMQIIIWWSSWIVKTCHWWAVFCFIQFVNRIYTLLYMQLISENDSHQQM